MKAKCLEVRDRMTFIPVMAVMLTPTNEGQRWLLRRSGYSTGNASAIVTNLNDGRSTNDPYDWSGVTMPTAHEFILKNWATLSDGDVIDCEFIRGETAAAKRSERDDL